MTISSAGSPGGVQSIYRALDVLECVAGNGGTMAIGEIASATALPLPTIHRLLKTLVERGYMRQLRSRRYALGFRLVPLGVSANSMIGLQTEPILAELADVLGETANLAVLSGDHAQYVAQAPSRHSMRTFTEVGRQVELHCTGVGKAMLTQLAAADVDGIVRRVGLTGYTPTTLTTSARLHEVLEVSRAQGYVLDEQEQEAGVRCVAVPVVTASGSVLAVSISGPMQRVTEDLVARAVPLLQDAARRLADELESVSGRGAMAGNPI